MDCLNENDVQLRDISEVPNGGSVSIAFQRALRHRYDCYVDGDADGF